MADDATSLTVTQQILADAFGRVNGLVHAVLDDLPADALDQRPTADANPIGWLVWHLARVQDDHLAGTVQQEQVWTADGWAARFDLPLPESDIGYGHSTDDVASVSASADLLRGYHDAVHERTLALLAGFTDDEYDRVVDERFHPPVTLAVRLVSVISDCLQHAGQAAYVRGLLTD